MSDITSIPKIIHYIWVGGKPLTPLAERCLASWKTYLPDYEIRLWNELNSPMDHPYVQEMYAQKKWAFVSDYIRFWALKNEGGVYLDTDMELIKPLHKLIGGLTTTGFVGASRTGQIESSIIGAVPQAEFILAALNFYDTTTVYTIKDTSPLVLGQAIASAHSPVTTFPDTYFFPCAEGEYCGPKKLQSAYGRHHWAESWVPYAKTRKVLRRVGLMGVVKKIKSLVGR
jgi:mannosyltransferase OCH1-like enzyme